MYDVNPPRGSFYGLHSWWSQVFTSDGQINTVHLPLPHFLVFVHGFMLTSVILFCWLGIWVAYSLLQNRFIFPIILVLHVPHVTRFTKHVCNKVFFSQQFGHKIGEGRFRGKALPTYVYPDCLFQAIWTIINASLRDYLNPKLSAVSFFFFFLVLLYPQQSFYNLMVPLEQNVISLSLSCL